MAVSPPSLQEPVQKGLTQIPKVAAPIKLQLSPELLAFFKSVFQTMKATISGVDQFFPEWRHVTVNNLLASLAQEEREREPTYRDKISTVLYSVPLAGPHEDRMQKSRYLALKCAQNIADIEAGRSTTVPLVKPHHLLESDKLEFHPLRHLAYLTEHEPNDRRQQCQEEMKTLDNTVIRKRYVDACKRKFFNQGLTPEQLIAEESKEISWEQLSLVWLEITWDDPSLADRTSQGLKRPDPHEIDVRYCLERQAFLIEAFMLRFFYEQTSTDLSLKLPEFKSLRSTFEEKRGAFKKQLKNQLKLDPATKSAWQQFYQEWTDLLATTISLKEGLESLKNPTQVDSSPPLSPRGALSSRSESPRTIARLLIASPRNQLGSHPKPNENAALLPPGSAPVTIVSPRLRSGTGSTARLQRVDSLKKIGSPRKTSAPLLRTDSKAALGASPSSPTSHPIEAVMKRIHLSRQHSSRHLNRSLGDLISTLQKEIKLIQTVEKKLKLLTGEVERAAQPSLRASQPLHVVPEAPVLFFDQAHPAAGAYLDHLQLLIQYADQIAVMHLESIDRHRPIAFLKMYEAELSRLEDEENGRIAHQLSNIEETFKRDNLPEFYQNREAYEDRLAYEKHRFEVNYLRQSNREGRSTLPLFEEDGNTLKKGRVFEAYANKNYPGRPVAFNSGEDFVAHLHSRSLLDFAKIKLTTGTADGPVAEFSHALMGFIQDRQRAVEPKIAALLAKNKQQNSPFFKPFGLERNACEVILNQLSFEELNLLEGRSLCQLYEVSQDFKELMAKKGDSKLTGSHLSGRADEMKRLLEKMAKSVDASIANLAANLDEQEGKWRIYLEQGSKAEFELRVKQYKARLALLDRVVDITRHVNDLLVIMKLQAMHISRSEADSRPAILSNLELMATLLPVVAGVVFRLPLPVKEGTAKIETKGVLHRLSQTFKSFT